MTTSTDEARATAKGEARSPISLRRAVARELRGYLQAFALAFLVVTFLFTTVGVVGASMRPSLDGGGDRAVRSLLVGDRVFIPKIDTWLRRAGVLGPYDRGAIVVLREPTSSPDYLVDKVSGCFASPLVDRCRPFFIKRVIGRPGDVVSIDAGRVSVNGVEIDQGFITATGEVAVQPVDFPRVTVRRGAVDALEIGFVTMPSGVPYPVLPTAHQKTGFVAVDDPRVRLFYGTIVDTLAAPPGTPDGVPVIGSLRVPAGHYFVMGDNRARYGSEDSRYFGAVRAIDIAGRATAVVWPPLRDGRVNWRSLSPPAAFSEVP